MSYDGPINMTEEEKKEITNTIVEILYKNILYEKQSIFGIEKATKEIVDYIELEFYTEFPIYEE